MQQDRSVMRALAMVGQFGINMLVPIAMCSFIGYGIDRLLETSFFVVILFFVGALAGGRNVYIFAKKVYDSDERKGKSHVSRIKENK